MGFLCLYLNYSQFVFVRLSFLCVFFGCVTIVVSTNAVNA